MKNIVEIAREFAYRKHNQPSDCQRYGALPYSVHLEAVLAQAEKFMYYIPEEKRDIIRIACLCHDTIEDTDVSEKLLEQKFGSEVADIVYRVSNERGRDRKERNFKTYPKIWRSDLAIFVKLADRIANTTNSKKTGHSMFRKYKSEYGIFRYALKVRGLYSDMWKELDLLNNWNDPDSVE